MHKKRLGQIAFGSCAGAGIFQAFRGYYYPEDGVSVDQKAALIFGIPPEVTQVRIEKELQLRRAKSVSVVNRILYGDRTIEEVRSRKEKFGNVEWNDEVLDEIRRMSQPILEVCAGDGQWANALRDRGVDVVATDNLSAPSRPASEAPRKGVIKEDAVESTRKHRNRVLLMVYPPPGPLCNQVLEAYEGDNLIYVGEGLSGINADEAFFCAVRLNWNIRKVVELPTLADSYEKAFFLERIKKES